jgi:hypothetical protein
LRRAGAEHLFQDKIFRVIIPVDPVQLIFILFVI